MPAMPSTPRGWRTNSAGGRARILTAGSRRRSAGISTTNGGGSRFASATTGSGWDCSRPREAELSVRMVVTGREGQVVRSIAERAKGTDVEVVSIGRPDLDLAGSADAIVRAVEEARPDVLVSAAAYTQVDRAEAEPELAFA